MLVGWHWRPHLSEGSGTHVKLGRKENSTENFDPAVPDGGSMPSGNGDVGGKRKAERQAGPSAAWPARHRTGAGGSPTARRHAPRRRPIDEAAESVIVELLLETGLANDSQIGQALVVQEESGQRLGEILVHMGVLGERDLARVLGEVFRMPVVDLRRDNPEPRGPRPGARGCDAASTWPSRFGSTTTGSTSPWPTNRPTSCGRCSSRPAATRSHFALAPESDVRWAIDSSYRAIGGVAKLVQAFEAVEGSRKRARRRHRARGGGRRRPGRPSRRPHPHPGHARPGLRRAHRAVAGRGPGPLPYRRRAEGGPDAAGVHGPRAGEPDQDHGGHEHRRASPAPGRPVHHRGRRRSIDVRVATTADHLGREVRHADPRQDPLRAPARRPRHAGRHPRDLLARSSGPPSAWCCAPDRPGSGKTTTLYATLTEINDPSRNIMTIEDPVEYVFPSINQIQTNEQAGLTFATGLKSILRQDPDVILVGEIRDVETARIAVQSALTGHFVLSSLHATDSVVGPAPLPGHGDRVVPHRLVGPRRRRPAPGAADLPVVQDALHADAKRSWPSTRRAGGPAKADFYHGTGCNFCGDTGYQDRIGVYEFLQMTPEIRRLIVGWATQDELRRLAQKQGMRTLRDEAISLVAQDITTIVRSHPQHLRAVRRRDELMKKYKFTALNAAGEKVSGSEEATIGRCCAPRVARTRSPAAGGGREEEEHPPIRDHEEEGAPQGAHALLPPAGRVREGRHPDHGGAGGHRARRRPTSSSRRPLST